MKRSGKVWFKDRLAGTVWRDQEWYGFQYVPEYLAMADAQPVSWTLPLKSGKFLT